MTSWRREAVSSLGHHLQSKTLRHLHQRAGLTQGQLAERLGVTCHAIQALGKCQRAVRKGWDFKLAEALGCSVSDLREAESVARSKKWRQAWINLIPKVPSTRPSDAGVTVSCRRSARCGISVQSGQPTPSPATSPMATREWRGPMKHNVFW
jgi:plasmid maintenance system antidote protein VapI